MSREQRTRRTSAEALAAELAGFPDLPLSELKARWEVLFGNPPPMRLGRRLMVRAIAYGMQAEALGGLSASSRRHLARAATAVRGTDLRGGAPKPSPPTLKPGTRLLREWRGVVHEVLIREEGIDYRGQTWPSLSAVAREITGTRWSGPLFFGLRARPND